VSWRAAIEWSSKVILSEFAIERLLYRLGTSRHARGRLAGPPDAEQVSERLRAFLLPLLEAASHGDPFERTWPPGGPWQP